MILYNERSHCSLTAKEGHFGRKASSFEVETRVRDRSRFPRFLDCLRGWKGVDLGHVFEVVATVPGRNSAEEIVVRVGCAVDVDRWMSWLAASQSSLWWVWV